MSILPFIFLTIGTLGVILHIVSLTPLLNDRGALTIRVRMVALFMLGVGMVLFGVSFVLLR